MKHIKQITAAALSVLLISSMTVTAFAGTTPSEKEEVIYVMADASGKVTDMEAVNIFMGGNITDYGDYSSVKILNTTDKIIQNGNKITFSSDAAKVYYQGTMKSTVIPWNISIRYFLDGKEYSAEDIAGKSGELEIQFSVSKNERCTGDFYENYALQASFTLDTDLCKNIISDGATAANIGSDKQLTYTILPGKGIDTVIKANVTEFEMDAVAINGIKLNLNVEIDDAELMDKVTELMDATKKLNDGSDKLNTNSGTLKDGSSSLNSGLSSLHSGVTNLDSGIATLQNGISSAQTALNTLNNKSYDLTTGSAQIKTALEKIQSNLIAVSASANQLTELTNASSEIKEGINDLYDGAATLKQNIGYGQYKALLAQNGLDIDALKAGNAHAINELSTQVTDLQQRLASIENVPGYEAQAAQLQAQISSLQNVIQLLSGNNAAIGGTENYLDSLASGVDSLYENLGKLKENYDAFDAKIGELAGTLSEVLVKISSLSSGIDELVTKYSALDNGINEYTSGVAGLVAGYRQIVDGVSSLASGSKTLLSGSNELTDGARELYDGIASYCDGVSELANGTNELYTQTDGMDEQVQDKIDEILASIGGEETETVSFVSEKNTNVDSVQFIIKTVSIEKAEAVVTDTAEEAPLNFRQKLLRMFGLY